VKHFTVARAIAEPIGKVTLAGLLVNGYAVSEEGRRNMWTHCVLLRLKNFGCFGK
jgi:hypothetical protein